MLHFPRCLVSVYSATALVTVLSGCSGEPFQTGDFAGAPHVGGTSNAGASAGGSGAGGVPLAFAGGKSGEAGSGGADGGGSAAAGTSAGGSAAAGTSAGGADVGGAGSAPMGGSGGGATIPIGSGGSAGSGGSTPMAPTGVPLDRHSFRVSASNTYFPETKPEYAIDADPQSCWASGTPQAPNMWFLVDLHEPQYFFRVDVGVIEGSSDFGRHMKLSASVDGKTFKILRDDIEGMSDLQLTFSEAKYARYLKLEITADAGGLWWRIDDLQVLQ